MSESQINLTEGSGKSLHTWARTIGGTAKEDQFLMAAEPTMATYTVIAPALSVASAGKHLLQVMGDGTNYIRLRRIEVQQVANAGTVAQATFQLKLLTTAGTGGTAVNARPHDEGDTDPYAGDTRYSVGTAGTEGTLLWQHRMNMSYSGNAAGGYADNSWEWNAPSGNVKPYIAGPGTADGFVLVNSTAIGTATVDVLFTFTISAYL